MAYGPEPNDDHGGDSISQSDDYTDSPHLQTGMKNKMQNYGWTLFT